ncbi:MAG: M43 family zinc metalloprotease, partial [Flammeovirgaceae bacterium]
MKKLLLSMFALMLGLTIQVSAQRTCNSDYHAHAAAHPEKVAQIEQHTQNYIQAVKSGRLAPDGQTIIIPVVVHIIYANSQENISDAQIQSQIDVLNEDFAQLNADYNPPSEFAAVAAGNTQIQFEMATVDPNGNPTNGITRKSSSRTSWGTNDAMKSSAQGGVDAWDASQYLNMWVCNIGGGILGYAQFPGGAAATDGVVMSPQYFGSSAKGSGFYLSAPFDLGRTTTHEVGHWLNLRHIWGDGNCSVDDFVADTPTQNGSNGGCPSYPDRSCTNNGGFSSDMFMNYMDYVNDACMYMFSAGQKDRMRAVLLPGGFRDSFSQNGGGGGGGSCGTTVAAFPYSESFESGAGAWTQGSGDDLDWTRDSGGTPSSNTGPASGSDGSWYMYVEASSPNYPSKTTYLDGPCFDLSGESSATFEFDYHMNGTDMGSLTLEAKPDGGSWTSVWNISGSQGTAW